MEKLTAEQLSALNEFASKNGRRWKSALSNCWASGRYPYNLSENCDSYLQQVRNRIGPSGLVRFKLS